MKVIPVLDLLRGVVVRGIGGRREEYKRIQSQLCDGSSPAAVAAALAQFGFRETYVADLDAIAGAEPAWANYEAIAAAGLRLMVDGGIGTVEQAARLAEQPFDLVAGLESLTSPETLAALVQQFGAERVVFSLDLKDGEPLARAEAWRTMTPSAIANEAVISGVRRMIILDLARVGENRGAGTEELAGELRRRFPDLTLIGGGGVRSLADLLDMQRAGFDAALVASALHDGKLTAHELRDAGMISAM